MFEEVHGLAEWVATYDDLLDNDNSPHRASVLFATGGSVPTAATWSFLRHPNCESCMSWSSRRLAELSLGISDERLAGLAKRMIGDADAISGDIVFRAAKRGVAAGD